MYLVNHKQFIFKYVKRYDKLFLINQRLVKIMSIYLNTGTYLKGDNNI